jgi:hypothetical protein
MVRTGRRMRVSLPLLLPSLLLSSLLLLPTACEPGAAPPGQSPVVLQPLLDRIDRLVAVLEADANAPPTTTAAPVAASADPVRTAAAAPGDTDRIAQLEREIARLTAMLTSRPIPYANVPAPPKAAAAVAPLMEALHDESRGREHVRRAMFHRTEDEILQQLGTPDDVIAAASGAVVWVYREGDRELNLHFVRGRVVTVSH